MIQEGLGVKQLFSLCVISASLLAQSGLYQQGETLYFEKGCNGCHGTKAEGITTYPRLANRAKGYLTAKLKRFRSNLSDNQRQQMMIPFAQGLSDEEIDAITTFLSEFTDTQKERYEIDWSQAGDGGS